MIKNENKGQNGTPIKVAVTVNGKPEHAIPIPRNVEEINFVYDSVLGIAVMVEFPDPESRAKAKDFRDNYGSEKTASDEVTNGMKRKITAQREEIHKLLIEITRLNGEACSLRDENETLRGLIGPDVPRSVQEENVRLKNDNKRLTEKIEAVQAFAADQLR